MLGSHDGGALQTPWLAPSPLPHWLWVLLHGIFPRQGLASCWRSLTTHPPLAATSAVLPGYPAQGECIFLSSSSSVGIMFMHGSHSTVSVLHRILAVGMRTGHTPPPIPTQTRESLPSINRTASAKNQCPSPHYIMDPISSFALGVFSPGSLGLLSGRVASIATTHPQTCPRKIWSQGEDECHISSAPTKSIALK